MQGERNLAAEQAERGEVDDPRAGSVAAEERAPQQAEVPSQW